MANRTIFAAAATATVLGVSGYAVSQPRAATAPVAVELFTSQGCSSCPPADKIMNVLARDPRVVAITRPVTYWDNLGWKDTLARPENTNLQRAYATRGFAGGGVYTPQSVVHGRSGAVGGRGDQVQALIANAAKLPQPMLTVARTPAGGATVEVAGATSAPARVTLIALRSNVDVVIGRGENGGRKIAYSNVLVAERDIGRWTGGVARFAAAPPALKVVGADRYALIVRQGDAGPILAARYL